MLLSIIIPVYNIEKYIEKCIKSVLEQRILGIELILIDDGSKDNSGKICDEFAKKYSNIFVIHKKNGGLSDARNHGIQKAKGEYILFLDGDDFLLPNSLNKIKDILFKNNKIDVLLHKRIFFYEKNNKMVKNKQKFNLINFNNKTLEKKILYLLRENLYEGNVALKIVKKEIIIKNEIFFETGLISEDIEWSFRLFFTTKDIEVFATNLQFYVYRKSRIGSISNSPNIKSVFDVLKILNKWERFFRNLDDLELKKEIYNYLSFIYVNTLISFSLLNKNDNDYEQLKKLLKENIYLLKFSLRGRNKYIEKFYNCFGFNLTIIALRYLRYLKNL